MSSSAITTSDICLDNIPLNIPESLAGSTSMSSSAITTSDICLDNIPLNIPESLAGSTSMSNSAITTSDICLDNIPLNIPESLAGSTSMSSSAITTSDICLDNIPLNIPESLAGSTSMSNSAITMLFLALRARRRRARLFVPHWRFTSLMLQCFTQRNFRWPVDKWTGHVILSCKVLKKGRNSYKNKTACLHCRERQAKLITSHLLIS